MNRMALMPDIFLDAVALRFFTRNSENLEMCPCEPRSFEFFLANA